MRDDPGKVTYNLLLKNELLGAGVDQMQVGRSTLVLIFFKSYGCCCRCRFLIPSVVIPRD